MNTTRARATASILEPLDDVVDEFLPPLRFVPEVSLAAHAELANVVIAHDAAEAALVEYMDAHPRRQSHGRDSTLHNERARLRDEGHPLATAAFELEAARRMAREVFRMHMVENRDAWAAHLDALTRRDLDNAAAIVTDAAARIRAAAIVPANHRKRVAAFDRMAEGRAYSDWWAEAIKPARFPVGARLVNLDGDVLALLEALAQHLTALSTASTDDEVTA